ncbi:MAG TPA: cupin domain-containing protein [Bryobacteraceae bacterium]|jgi:quercetin dioxygenase-like cupin family protein
MDQALVVEAEQSRWGEPACTSPDHIWTKISRKDTAGAWSMFESRVPPGLAVPLHQHHSQEEWFWVLEGTFWFEVGGHKHRLTAGMSLLAPRRVPHRWTKTNASSGRVLILAQPADRLEDFFDRFARMSPEHQHDMALTSPLFADCGMELLGPPMEPPEE